MKNLRKNMLESLNEMYVGRSLNAGKLKIYMCFVTLHILW